MTVTPLFCVIDPRNENEVREFMRKLEEGYKIVSASGMHHEVVYVLLKANE